MNEDIWFMESDFCSECGCILEYGDAGLCGFCWREVRWNDEHEFDDAWFYEDEGIGPEVPHDLLEGGTEE